MPKVENAERAPCGCKWGSLDGMFVFEPCSPTCDLYGEVVERGRKDNKKIAHVDKELGSFISNEMFCPGCDHKLDGHKGVNGAMIPDDGSVTICIYCNGVFIWENGRLRHPTFQEESEIRADPDVQKTFAAIAEMRD